MTTKTPDIFTNVHKGIRKALFDACSALGRAGDDESRTMTARRLLKDAVRFTIHHGENEDVLLLPLLEQRAPACFDRMQTAHGAVNDALTALASKAETAPTDELYRDACAATALYLEHTREEEQALEPAIREALTVDELAAFGRRSVERTAPDDQRMMLSFMLPAMTRADAEAFLSRLPSDAAERLRPLVG